MSNWRDHIQVIVVPMPGQSDEQAKAILDATETKIETYLRKEAKRA